MIRYTLTCNEGHEFESWFSSASTFESLLGGGRIACTTCGGSQVQKALMAPALVGADTSAPKLTAPASPAELALARMRDKVESSSEYVGTKFAAEARAMHAGDMPERSIWGEARPDEARQLIEEGVPVLPLPFVSTRKAN